MNREEILDTALKASAVFLTVSIGVAVCSSVPAIKGLKAAQEARIVETMANAHRMTSLAKTYDAKAAVAQMKVLSECL